VLGNQVNRDRNGNTVARQSVSFLTVSSLVALSCGGHSVVDLFDGSAVDGRSGAGSGAIAGTAGLGGSSGIDGAAGSSGGTTAASCSPGEKLCSGYCVEPYPLVGCSLGDCEKCPGAVNADPICEDDNRCGLQCIPGYELRDGTCQLVGTGGFGGGDGSAGTSASGGATDSGSCDPLECSPTICTPPFAGYVCCMQSGNCGCTWAPGAPCYPPF
jgi:hypothetical protein